MKEYLFFFLNKCFYVGNRYFQNYLIIELWAFYHKNDMHHLGVSFVFL